LKEIYRVLKPREKLFFIAHELSDNPKTQIWQHRLTPIQKIIADGYHLDRNIAAIVKQQFRQFDIHQFTPENLFDLIAHFYKRSAKKRFKKAKLKLR
jgi:hypothetical protein